MTNAFTHRDPTQYHPVTLGSQRGAFHGELQHAVSHGCKALDTIGIASNCRAWQTWVWVVRLAYLFVCAWMFITPDHYPPLYHDPP